MTTHPNLSILIKILTLFVIVLLVPRRADSNISAQESEDNWSVPVNLSASGSSTDPVMIIDSVGLFHVIWNDEFAGFIYTTGDGVTWSPPIPVELPSGDFKPWLVADLEGRIHAFWIGEESALFYSRVNSAEFTILPSWSQAQTLSDSVVDLDVTVSELGQIHLSYIRTISAPELPAGLYYLRFQNESGGWSSPQLLYESAYFRSLDIETAHVEVVTATSSGVDQVYVAWDNRPRARIFFAKSADNGETWGSPLEVDKPETGESAIVPADIGIHVAGEDVLLLWKEGSTETSCVNYYQWSEDGGDSWQSSQTLLGELGTGNLISCPEDIQILSDGGNPFLLVKAIQNYLIAWDGERWSDPQIQNELSNFTDPETQKVVEYSCIQANMRPDNQIFVVGCDAGISGDIWFTSKQITSIDGWFPAEPVWGSPVELVGGDFDVIHPVLVSDAANQIHAFWSQINRTVTDNLNEVIYYTRQEAGGEWTIPVEVLRIPEESLRQASVVDDSNGNLLLVSAGSQTGKIYFTAAPANQAVLPATWSDPVVLPSPQSAASSPDIHIAPDGTIFVAYAVPLNQERGIYLVRSDDSGATWSNPLRIFDADVSGWAMVDRPLMAITRDTHLHLIWTEYSLPSGPGPLALYYTRSEDFGESWSEPEQVIRKLVPWSGITGTADQSLHRMWQEVGSGGITIWHDYSNDDGITWTRISPVSIFNEKVSPSGLVLDQAGTLNLLQVVNRGSGNLVLQHWLWDGMNWTSEASLIFDRAITTNVDDLSATISGAGELGVVYSSSEIDVGTGETLENLSFTRRTMGTLEGTQEVVETTLPSTEAAPELTPTPEPTLTATVAPEETSTAALPSATTGPTAVLTPTRSFEGSPPINTGGILGSSGINLIIGILIVGFVAILAIGAWFYNQRRVRL